MCQDPDAPPAEQRTDQWLDCQGAANLLYSRQEAKHDLDLGHRDLV